MTDTIFPAALEILQATNDGDNLDPQHLKLVELAVNGLLNEAGKAAFAELLANVRSGYTKPWFHGIEHLTRDHEGYVRWKGHAVEHYEPTYASTADAQKEAGEIARRCRIIEARGQTPNTGNVIWSWPDDAQNENRTSQTDDIAKPSVNGLK